LLNIFLFYGTKRVSKEILKNHLIYEESGMNFVLLLCIQLLFTWTYQHVKSTSKSADQLFFWLLAYSKLQILSVIIVLKTF